ncbi:diguanylate cyclase domain-containing protein [Acetobacter estunensis]|uniref:diguanylate cyclase domain-containing protein n=1 Tax=Acetobacter estunensis TaxID=104097 RepID=UPI001C2CD449|nr:diguanylate cyclase [Acetobacter estunensis]
MRHSGYVDYPKRLQRRRAWGRKRAALSIAALTLGVLLGACVGSPAVAQTVRLFDGQGGLSASAVQAFAQDRDGFLYIGGHAGLYVSSGGEFTRVDVGDHGNLTDVSALAASEASDQLMVVAHDGVWLRADGAFRHVPLPVSGRRMRVAAFAHDFIVMDERGALWRVRSRKNEDPLVERFALTAPGNSTLIDDVALDASALGSLAVQADTLWMGCGGGALCRVRNGALVVFGKQQGVPSETWNALTAAPDGGVTARGATHLLRIGVKGDVHAEPLPSRSGNVGNFRPSFVVEMQGGSVVTSVGETLMVRSPDGAWREMDSLPGYGRRDVTAAFVDRENGLWLAGAERGVMRVAGFPFWKSVSPQGEHAPSHVSIVHREGGNAVWLATSNGLFRYTIAEGGDLTTPLAHYDIDVKSMVRSTDGALWIVEKSGTLLRLDVLTGRVQRLASLSSLTGALDVDSAGRLWVGTMTGLVRLDDPVHPPARLPRPLSLRDRRVNALSLDQFGRLLVLTDTVLFRQKAAEDVFDPQIDVEEQGIGAGRLMAVSTNNDVWIAGERGGVRKVTLPEEGEATVTGADGVHGQGLVQALFRDSRGWIWMGGLQGLDILSPSGWTHLDTSSGLTSNAILPGAISEDDDGTMWFGTEGGLSRLTDPAHLPALPQLHTRITSARLGSVDLLSRPMDEAEGHQELRLEYVAPTFVGHGSLRYHYHLMPLDEDEHETSAMFVTWPDMKGKQISFDVQAVDVLYGRSATAASFHAAQTKGASFTTRMIVWGFCSVLVLVVGGMITFRAVAAARRRHIEQAVRGRTRFMEEMQAQLRQQSRVDVLTGLLNRRAVCDELESLMNSIGPDDLMAVALIDIDHFKAINDTLGHQGGDFVLEQYGHRLRQGSGVGAVPGRYGGEELIVVFTSIPSVQALTTQVGRLHELLREPLVYEGHEIVVTCSIGLAVRIPGDTPGRIVGRADRALYRGKRNGRNCVVMAD